MAPRDAMYTLPAPKPFQLGTSDHFRIMGLGKRSFGRTTSFQDVMDDINGRGVYFTLTIFIL
jgi:hypothetical protein